MTVFGMNLKRKLDDMGITQKEFSKMTGISRPSLSQYLTSDILPSKERRKLIAKTLNIPLVLMEQDIEKDKYRFKQSFMNPDEAAKLMGKSPEWVREGLKAQRFPFGYGVEMPGGRWSYWISPKLFQQFTGIDIEEENERIKKELTQNVNSN